MSEESSSKLQMSSRIAGNVAVRRLADVPSAPLPQRIVGWAENLRLGHSEIVSSEWTCRSAPQITVEEAELACKHDLVPVFEFLTSRVRPRHEVELIRNTLDAALNRPELAKLPKFRRLIQRRQARLKGDELKDEERRESALHAAGQLRQLRELQRGCKDLATDIERTDRDIAAYKTSVADSQRRIVTLETFQSTLDDFSGRLDEYSDVLNKTASRFKPVTIAKPDDPSSVVIRSYLESSVDPIDMSTDAQQGIVQSSLSTTQEILHHESQKAETDVVVAVQELRGIESGAEANEWRSGTMDALGDVAQTHVDRLIEVEDLRRKAARTKGEVEVRTRQMEQSSQFRRFDTERRVKDKFAIDLRTFKSNYLRALEAKHTRIQEVWSPVNDLWWRMQSADQNLILRSPNRVKIFIHLKTLVKVHGRDL
ncbi:hypothetical protein M427DRAFT_263748 [Gonapodya prolifera JEL478]|uniref:Uncharacterized protein n=1 Tax=Gonapodya prolifera (strain JEL478) TaxID=1344416 RepID=A0A139AKQ4_GONPJ|nr:hypothetical protein M427DRAFT_263748 [Gonapodya prolifera JEL478]|eukprot:KXS17114.1 hypothetical protein M427DRAFT_263748 [Gonapodya prolifera JEL478]